MDAKYYGWALRKSREKAGINQVDLARAAGMPPSNLSALETQGRGLKPELFILLCRLMKVDPLAVADRGYFGFRKELGEKAARTSDMLQQGEVGSAIPSQEEVVRQFDSMMASSRSFLLTYLRYARPDEAASAFLADRFQDFDGEPEPPIGKGKGKRRRS